MAKIDTTTATEAPKKKRERKLDENGNPVENKRELFLVFKKGADFLVNIDGSLNTEAFELITRNAKTALSLVGKSNGSLGVATIMSP